MKRYKNLFLIFVIFLSGCSDILINEPEINKNLEDYEAVYKIVKEDYPFLKFKNINWDSLYNKFKTDAESAKGDEIYSVLYSLLENLKDGHVEVCTKGGNKVLTYVCERDKDRKTFEPLVVRKYFIKPVKLACDDKIAYEILDNQIGYIHFPSFSEGDWVNDFDNVLINMINTKGLIIDVRNNNGGNTATTDFIISRFIEDHIQYSLFDSKENEDKMFITPCSTNRYLKPVVILINGASFSAGELFPEIMRQLPNVTLIGKTTGGGGGGTKIEKLPSGKGIRLPYLYFIRLDGSMIEWNGVLPDIFIEQTEIDIQNQRDKQLEYAINFLIHI